MAFLIQYVADFASWIYAVCGGVALYQLYKAWHVRIERRQAVFSLEREKAMGDLYKIFLTAVLLLVAMGSTYFVSTTLADAVQAVVAESLDPTSPVLSVPTLTATPLPATPTPTVTPTAPPAAAAVQEAAQPVNPVVLPPTATPVPAVAQPICPDSRAVILSPGAGQIVSGSVSIQGTAVHEDFWYYKLEFAPGNGANGSFGWFDGGENQVRNGYLGSFNSGAVANGTYTIRVVSVDSSGNFPPPCLVTITVQN